MKHKKQWRCGNEQPFNATTEEIEASLSEINHTDEQREVREKFFSGQYTKENPLISNYALIWTEA